MPAHHDRHAGHSVAMFRDRFWLSLLLTIPVIVWSPDPRSGSATRRPRSRARHGSRRSSARSSSSTAASLPARRGRRAARPAARDDDADLARHPRRVRHELGEHARLARRRDLVGARDPHHDHAARPLARDALDRPGARRARRARRAAARHGRAGDRGRDGDGGRRGPPRRRRRARAARWPRPGRRRGRRRRRRRRRVD